MPRLAALNRRERGVGREESVAMPVPLGTNQCVMRMPRNSWPIRHGEAKEGEVVEAFAEFSFDGGATWPFVRGVGSHGGDYFNRRGDLVVETTLTFYVPEADNPNRLVRVKLDRHAPGIDTRVDLDFEQVAEADVIGKAGGKLVAD